MLALSIVGGTVRAAAAAATATTPNLALIALGPADLQGAKVASQHSVKDPNVVAAYAREFKQGTRVGKTITVGLENDIAAFSSATEAHTDYANLKKFYGSPAGRAVFTAAILSEAKKDAKKKGSTKVTFGRMQTFSAGGEAFLVPINVTLSSIRFPVSISIMRSDRIESTLFMMAFPGTKIAPADVARLQRIVADHVVKALTPASAALPTVAGTAAPGQVLMGTDGTWTNEPTTFTRSWLRCDAAGANCTAIPGATTNSYTVQDGDAGSTIRFSVVAANASGTAPPAISAQTAVVPVPVAPPPAA